MDPTVEAYAVIMAELLAAPAARGAVLARHGLDEDAWAEVDTRWQARLSEAMDVEGDDVSPILSAYAAAYAEAQRAHAPPITIERFAQVTRFFQANGDIVAALSKVGVSFADYVRGSEHWSRRMTEDPDLEQRFHAALAGQAMPGDATS